MLSPICLTEWLTPPPPWSDYRDIMECRRISIDKYPGVCPIGIGEKLRRATAKFVMRVSGYQEKTACGSLQLCAGLESGIEKVTHAVAQRRQWRADLVPEGRAEEDSEDGSVAAADDAGRDGYADIVGCGGGVTVPPGGA